MEYGPESLLHQYLWTTPWVLDRLLAGKSPQQKAALVCALDNIRPGKYTRKQAVDLVTYAWSYVTPMRGDNPLMSDPHLQKELTDVVSGEGPQEESLWDVLSG